jgi:polysaccharide export outer membrane protein
MLRRTFGCLCLGLLATGWLAPARAAEQTNLVDRLRAAMAPPEERAQNTNQVQTLTSGDILQLTVYQEDDLNLPRAVIAKDGTISHPLLGSIAVGGKTLEQAQTFIHDLLQKDYLVNPRVSLTVLAYAKYRITIIGEVVRPDTYEVSRNDTLTLMQAIARAGGPTRLGNMSKVTVQRVVGDQKKELKLDAETKGGKAFVIQTDDVIEVPAKGR